MLARALGQRGDQRRARRPRTSSPAARSCSASAVSSTSEEVSPKWIQRPAWPAERASTSTNAAMSWSVTFSRSWTAADRESGFADRLKVRVAGAICSKQAGQLLARRDLNLAPTRPCAPDLSTARQARDGCSGGSRLRIIAGSPAAGPMPRGSAPPGWPRCAGCPGPRTPRARPGGICTIERIASRPPAAVRRPESGTPITGRSVWAATAPGSAAEMPGAGDDHAQAAHARVLGVFGDEVGFAMRGHDPHLVQDARAPAAPWPPFPSSPCRSWSPSRCPRAERPRRSRRAGTALRPRPRLGHQRDPGPVLATTVRRAAPDGSRRALTRDPSPRRIAVTATR